MPKHAAHLHTRTNTQRDATGYRLLHVPTQTLLRSASSTEAAARSFLMYLAPRTFDQYAIVPANTVAQMLEPIDAQVAR